MFTHHGWILVINLLDKISTPGIMQLGLRVKVNISSGCYMLDLAVK
jgi:hypothetical protein